jgi:hypothetical protein
MRERVRNAGVYLASANWQQLTYLVGIAIGVAHYITPALAAVIVPALAHHWLQARVLGARSLAQAAIFKAYVPPPDGDRFDEAEKAEGDK